MQKLFLFLALIISLSCSTQQAEANRWPIPETTADTVSISESNGLSSVTQIERKAKSTKKKKKKNSQKKKTK